MVVSKIDIYEKIAFVLNIGLLVLILVKLLDLMVIASAILILMVILLFYKLNFDEKIRNILRCEKTKTEQINTILNHINTISSNVLSMRNEVRRDIFAIESRLHWQKSDVELEIQKNYRELARKIIELENKLNHTRKTLAGYMSYLEEKVEGD